MPFSADLILGLWLCLAQIPSVELTCPLFLTHS
jgi:hypothetical protein